MNEKNMVPSSRLGITRTSSSSVYGKDFLELVWEKGQILAAADNRTQNTMRSSKRAKLSNNCYKPNEEFHSQETKKPRIFHSSLTATKNSEKQYLGSSSSSCDERTRKVINFSNFSIPAVFLKSTSARSSARVEKKIEYLKATEEVASTKGSHGFKEQISLIATKSKPESSLADKTVEPASSEALREKGKADDDKTNLCYERSSSSVCSLEASNNPNFSIRKYDDDTDDDDDDDDDDSAYLSDDDEETENLVNEKANRIKRSRNAESHSLSERKRRDKIDEKIRTLKDLIPNCNKVDKASMLDDAIDYLKTLKFQLEIMTMGRGLCMPHMMLPNHMNVAAQHLMGFRTAGDGGIPCTPSPPQFPIPPLSSVTDNRLQMFGFSNQMLPPMPIPNAPLFPMIGNTSTQPFNATNIATNLARHLANPGQLTTPEV